MRPVADSEDRATGAGWLAVGLGAMMALSAIPGYRFWIFGLSAHPYLATLVVLLPVALSMNPGSFRRGLGLRGVALLAGLAFANMLGSATEDNLRIMVKWASVGLTFFVVERLILTRRDFILAAYGIIGAVTFIAARGLYLYQLNPTYYVEVLQGIGSRNIYSFWTIAPTVFGLLLLTSSSVSKRMKILLVGALLTITVPQVLSLSRSGWLLLVGIFLLVFVTRLKLPVLVAGVLMVGALQYIITDLDFEERVQARFEDLVQGTASDGKRADLIRAGLAVFAKHPLFGVSQADLPMRLAAELGSQNLIESHNLYIDLLAGTGLVGVAPLALCILALIRRWKAAREPLRDSPELLRMLPVLAVAVAFRGLTGNEILFCPAIIFGLAASHGLHTSRGRMAIGTPGARERHGARGAPQGSPGGEYAAPGLRERPLGLPR